MPFPICPRGETLSMLFLGSHWIRLVSIIGLQFFFDSKFSHRIEKLKISIPITSDDGIVHIWPSAESVFPDDFLKNPYRRCRKNPYRLKKFRTFFFDMGIKLKDFASTIEIRHTFLNLIISNYFININHIFKCNSIPYTHTVI